jgi:ribonuclease-3
MRAIWAIRGACCKHVQEATVAKLPKFKNAALLRQALTHRSLPNHNERLEFIGDGILQGVVTSLLSQRYPTDSEDLLTKKRSKLVSNEALAKVAKNHQLGQQLYLAKNAVKQGGRKSPKILADAVEALIGAYFIDSGHNYVTAEKVVRQLLNL